MPNRCYRCNHLGQSSDVSIVAQSTTGVASRIYLDDRGCLHEHNPNLRTGDYTCSQGHRWFEVAHYRCAVPDCSFGDEDEDIRYIA